MWEEYLNSMFDMSPENNIFHQGLREPSHVSLTA